MIFSPWIAGGKAARFVRAGCPGVGGYCCEFRRAFPARLWMPLVEDFFGCGI